MERNDESRRDQPDPYRLTRLDPTAGPPTPRAMEIVTATILDWTAALRSAGRPMTIARCAGNGGLRVETVTGP